MIEEGKKYSPEKVTEYRKGLMDESYKQAEDRISKVKNRVFETGAQRDSNYDKPYIHNLKGYTRQRFGYHMTSGAKKYGDNNWELGMPTDQYLESVDRHLAAYLEGDRSEDHLAAMLFGIQGCMINEQKQSIPADHYFKQLNVTTKTNN